MKILKQENRHRIEKLVDINNFVFVDPLLPFGTIGKPTHIAHICKSHKPTHDQNLQKSAIFKSLTDLYRKGIHGIEHAYRVLLLVQELSELERLNQEQKKIIEFCAIFHDIGRINDDIDDFHGIRSIKKLSKFNYCGLSYFNTPIVKYIIENHCISDNIAFDNVYNYNIEKYEEAIYLLKLFKDSDNLDRVRLGDFNSKYLRLNKSKNLINTATSNFNRTYEQFYIIDDFYLLIINWEFNTKINIEL